MSLKVVDPSYQTYRMSPYNRPALYVDSGDTILFTAMDTYSNLLKDETCTFSKDMLSVDINPVNGPVYVNGAMPGDTLKVTIEDIEITGDGTMFLNEADILLFDQFVEREVTVKIPIKDGYADMFGNQVKLNPMLGILGISPKEKISTMFPGVHGGNMDCKYLTKGTSLYLPVQVPGALLATGDIHGKQGDGETVCGIEAPGKITLKVEVIKGKAEPWPVLETPDRWYVLASCDTIEKSNKAAVDAMTKFLFYRSDAYTLIQWICLMGICGDLEFCQVVDPLVTVRFGIDKSVAKGITF